MVARGSRYSYGARIYTEVRPKRGSARQKLKRSQTRDDEQTRILLLEDGYDSSSDISGNSTLTTDVPQLLSEVHRNERLQVNFDHPR